MEHKISHSEIQTFLDCQKKWHLRYHLKLKLDTIHTQFGNMAHSVLETHNIPEESLYPELKEEFGIKSWKDYFTTIINELRRRMADYNLLEQEIMLEHDYLKGKIDAVWRHKITGKYLLTDYKFSATKKDQMDLLIDQQLYVYAVLYSLEKNITLDNIEIGFITIPKTELDKPRVLSNGGLSKDKRQNTTVEAYRQAIKDLGLNEADYQDILDELAGKEIVSLEISSVSPNMIQDIFANIDHVYEEMQKGYYLEKASSFDCRRCDLFDECKVKRMK